MVSSIDDSDNRMSVGTWKERARSLKRELYAIHLSARHSRTPGYAKLCAAIIVAYALSPIDLIPDFIPVIGYVDELILIPAGLRLLVKMIPEDVLEECKQKAENNPPGRKIKSWSGAAAIVCLWVLAIYVTLRLTVLRK
jgi:uncharacterized membrane protein YkvA (DUF1232 family)